jgi:hypothetical protein
MLTAQTLAQWALDLRADQVPADVLQRARLQQLSCAGALRAAAGLPLAKALATGAPRGKFPVIGRGKKSSQRAALRTHATLLGALDYGDSLLWVSSSTAACTAAWALAGEHSAAELDLAIVAANEVSGRIGLAGMLAPSSGPAWLSTQAAASAIVAGRLKGLDASELAHALALALGCVAKGLSPTMAARGLATAAAVQAGLDAVDLAQGGAQGDLELLDREQGFYGAHGCQTPLRTAFAGLGQSWLTHTLSLKLRPGSLFSATATDALVEILGRHVRAADKRLRPDQWTDCRVRCAWPTWAMQSAAATGLPGLTWNLSSLFGVLGKGHEIGAEQLTHDWWQEELPAIEQIASTVRVEHHWAHTLQAGQALIEQLGPLFSELSISDLQAAFARIGAGGPKMASPVSKSELMALVKSRPSGLLGLMKRPQGDLSTIDLQAFRFTLPVDLRLSTTRGGFWPETRIVPEGGAGESLEQLNTRAEKKFAAGSPEHAERAATARTFSGTGQELLALLA